MAYPPGAGPFSGAFGGDVYVPPTSPLPGAVGTGAGGLATRPQIANAVADSGGIATFTAPPNIAWLVRRIVVQSDTKGRALVYVGTPDPANLVSGTIAGDLDENDANQPYLVPEGQSMVIVWEAGGNCQARIEYDEV